MSERSRVLQGVAAGIGAFLVDVWPVLLIWWAGSTGAVGDLSQVRFLGVGVLVSLAFGGLVGWLMTVALPRAETSPELGRFDPWGAYALGIGVYNLALTAVPAVMYALLLDHENQSLRDQAWLVYVLWVGGHVLAAAVGIGSGRWLLGSKLGPIPPRPSSGGQAMGQVSATR